MNKIPQRLHPSKLEIEDNLDFTPRRLKMEKEKNSEIQDTLDPNTIDNRSPEKAIHIFGSYKRYKNKKKKKESRLLRTPIKKKQINLVTNFIWPYLHQFFDDSHGLNGYGKPLKRPFDQYQSHLKAISIGQDIRQINQ